MASSRQLPNRRSQRTLLPLVLPLVRTLTEVISMRLKTWSTIAETSKIAVISGTDRAGISARHPAKLPIRGDVRTHCFERAIAVLCVESSSDAACSQPRRNGRQSWQEKRRMVGRNSMSVRADGINSCRLPVKHGHAGIVNFNSVQEKDNTDETVGGRMEVEEYQVRREALPFAKLTRTFSWQRR
jgi:hypothetical protein